MIIVMATGWSWEYVWENMTFQRLDVFTRVWKHSPAAHTSLAKIAFMLKKFLGFRDSIDDVSIGKQHNALSAMSDIEE